jgi:hypothetical protein
MLHGSCGANRMSDTLSSEARDLLAALTGGRRTRWPLDDLEAQHLQALPHLRGRPERRRELAGVIDELAAAGRVRPSVREDRTRMPALPAFVDVIRPRAPSSGGSDARGHGWRPELAGVHALEPPPTPGELPILRKLNRWLADRGADAPMCGSRERSLEVFGDEKLLDERLRYGRLFATGLLSYELLRCRRIAPGLVCEAVGQEPSVLIVENTDTFRSVLDVLRETPNSQVGFVAWGAGAAFEQSCEALLQLRVNDVPVRHAWYFGDIDPSGLRIPARASKLVAPLPLRPARALYALLLNRDQRGSGRERMGEQTEEHLLWLGEPLASQARLVMAAGSRLAQEALTAEVLRNHAELLVSQDADRAVPRKRGKTGVFRQKSTIRGSRSTTVEG